MKDFRMMSNEELLEAVWAFSWNATEDDFTEERSPLNLCLKEVDRREDSKLLNEASWIVYTNSL